jgi:hypothetical protein
MQNLKDKLTSAIANKTFIDTATKKARERAVSEGLQIPGTTAETYLRIPEGSLAPKTGGLRLPSTISPRKKAAQAYSVQETNEKKKP